MASSSESATATNQDDLAHPLPSNSHRHNVLERLGSKSHLSKQDEVEVTEDAVTQCEGSGADTTEVIATGVCDKSQNGETSHCPIIMTDFAEITGSESTASVVDDGSDTVVEVPQNVDPDISSGVLHLNSKMKLVRCRAVCDDASPSPPSTELLGQTPVIITEPLDGDSSTATMHSSSNRSSLNVSPILQMNSNDKTNQGENSSHSSTVSDGGQPSLMSCGSSVDATYTDATGINLGEFIIKTLNKNKADRSILMHLETDMTAFINDTSKEKFKFPPMTSYHRMLVHRVAAFFGLDHNVDEHGKCVVISRLPNTRVPDFRFRDHLRDDFSSEDQPKKSILRRHRDCTSLEENLGVDRIGLDGRKSKSFEERTEEYNEARSRIFRETPDDITESSLSVRDGPGEPQDGSATKDVVCWPNDGQQWRSADSSGYSTDSSSQLRAATGFQSVTVLSRGDSQTNTLNSSLRSLKADSIGSGVSNVGSVVTVPPPVPSSSQPPDCEAGEPGNSGSDNPETTSSGGQHQWHAGGGDGPSTGSPFLPFTDDHGEPLAIWVASTISQIPPGSIIINPRKGEPYTNPDGTIYRWYPPTNLAKTECPAEDELTPERVSAATVEQQSLTLTRQSSDQSQELGNAPVEVSTCSASKSTSTLTAATKSQRVPRSQINKSNSMSSVSHAVSSGSVARTQFIASTVPYGGAPPNMQSYTSSASSTIVSGRQHVVPPPTVVSVYNSSSGSSIRYCPASVAGPIQPIRFVCPQGLGYSPASSTMEQPSYAGDMSHYGYVPTYSNDSYQVTSFPPVGMSLPPTETYQQMQHQVTPQPVAVVQYTDKTWNQYSQPVTLLPGRGSVAGQVYYAVEPGIGGVPTQAAQCPVQFVVVSSASTTDRTHGHPVVYPSQPSMMAGGVVVPANAHPTYLGSGPPSSGAQPQYIPYTYQPSQPLGGAAVPVMPLYPNVLTLPVPAATAGAPLRGTTPCLVPVVHPPAPINGRPLSHQSPSPKSFHFSVPPPHSGVQLRMSSVDLQIRPQDAGSDLSRRDIGSVQARISTRPVLNPRQPRFGSVRSTQNNNAFHQPTYISQGDSRFPRPPHQRMVQPPLPSSFHHKPRLASSNISNTSSVPVPREVHKSGAALQPRVGATAEGSVVLEVCGIPPGTNRQKVKTYLADLTTFGAKEFHIQDDPQVKTMDVTCVGSATVVAVFDSAASAQRALRDYRGNGYRLQNATWTYSLNHRS